MDRINAVCSHRLYRSKMEIIQRHEKTRIYCRHDMQHLLDVARVMYIRSLEEKRDNANDPFSLRELIYAAALLHDIGRADQYENGTPHDEAGAKTARIILKDCGFDENEINLITEAVRGHRGTEEGCAETGESIGTASFSKLLKEADKQSRLCFVCEARGTCKWPDEKKNMEIVI